MANNRKKRHNRAPNATSLQHPLFWGIVVGVSVSIGASLFLTLFFSAFASTLSDPLKYLDSFGVVSLIISGFIGGFVCMRFLLDNKAFAAIGIACLIRLLISFGIKLFLTFDENSFSLPLFLLFSFLFIASSIGGAFLGRRETRRRKSRRLHRVK